MARTIYVIRDNPAGNPVSGLTVDVDTATGTPLASPSTDGNGLALYEQDGSPGPMVASATSGGRTIRRDGRSQDQMGTWFPYDHPAFIRSIGAGVVSGYADSDIGAGTSMQVVPGTGLQITIGTGQIILDGHRYRCSVATNLAIGANASGSTRIDRVISRFTREGQTDEGKFELLVKAGTTSAPALTNDDTMVEFSLSQVRVINGASSFTSGDITDERYSTGLSQSYFPTFPAVRQAGDMWYGDAAGKVARLAKGTDGQLLVLTSGLPAWSSPTLTIIVQENDVTVDANVTTLDFDTGPFNVTSNPPGEANIDIADGGIAGNHIANNTVATGKLTTGTDFSTTEIAKVLKAGVSPTITPSYAVLKVSELSDMLGGAFDRDVYEFDNSTATWRPTKISNANVSTSAAIDASKIANATVSNVEYQFLNGVTDVIQDQINGKAATVHVHAGADITSGTINVARIPTAIPATSIGAGSVDNTELGYVSGLTSAAQTQLDGKSATTHTHVLTTPPASFATKTYASTNITSTAADGVEIAGFDMDVPTGGGVVVTHSDAQVNAPPSTGTYIEIGVKIGSQATDWGMRSQTAGGERPCSATSTRSYASGASAQRISLRARVDGGTGTVNAAHINGFCLTTRVPAS